MKKILCLILLSYSLVSLAAQKLDVELDCYLPNDAITCEEIRVAYFSDPNLVSVNKDGLLSFILRSLPLQNQTEFQFTLNGRGDFPDIIFKYPLNSNLSPAAQFEKVLVMMKKLTEPYKALANISEEDQQSVRDVPYYISPAISGSGSAQQGSSHYNGNFESMANYSTPSWRLVAGLGAGGIINQVESNDYTPGMSAKIFYVGSGFGVIRSVNQHWNLAVFARDFRVKNEIEIDGVNHLPENALSNKARKTFIKAGVEWTLIPFLTDTSSGNVAVRYSISGESHEYVKVKDYQYFQEEFIRHSFEIYFKKHYPKIDLDLSGTGFVSSFRSEPLKGVSGSASINYKINPRMTLGANFSLLYAKNQIPSPANGNNLNFSNFTSGNQKQLTYSGMLNLRYTLGNVRLYNQEQRWK